MTKLPQVSRCSFLEWPCILDAYWQVNFRAPKIKISCQITVKEMCIPKTDHRYGISMFLF